MRTCVSLVALLALASPALAHPGAHDDAYHADLPNYPTATRLPDGITLVLSPDQAETPDSAATEVKFDEFFLPPGRRGLEFTEKARSLEGKRVRLTGQMVRRCNHVPGQLMLTSRPVTLHEHEMGFADDLPMATVFVIAPSHDAFVLPFARVPLQVEGRLELGSRVEPDGRISTIRVVLDGEPGSYVEPTIAAPSDAHDGHDHEHHPH
jgi:hypothetical protein